MNKHVTSQALSKRLYEKGVRVDSEFSWVCKRARKYRNELDKWFLLETTRGCFYKKGNIYPALLSSEIGGLLPPFCTTYSTLDLSNSPKEFVCKQLNGVDIKHKNEAEARGLMLEYLKEQRKLIENYEA